VTAGGGHVAASDCERCRPGLVAQPVNTASSLAFVAAGVALLRSRPAGARRPPAEAAVAWAAVAAGLGSVAYHGPGGAVGRYVHDTSLLGLLAAVTIADVESVTGRPVPAATFAALPAVLLTAAHPATSMAAQAALGAAAAAAEASRFGVTARSGAARRRHRFEAVVAGTGALAHLLGRSGGPLCRPDRRPQPHALWHVAMAAAIWARGRDMG
jgi:hypothetical protein